MARTFNPLDREPAVLQLSGRDYEVAEATRAIVRRVSDIQKQLRALDDESSDDVSVGLIAQLIEASLVDGEGAAAAIIEAWNADELSLPALVRAAEFIGEELRGSVDVGEA